MKFQSRLKRINIFPKTTLELETKIKKIFENLINVNLNYQTLVKKVNQKIILVKFLIKAHSKNKKVVLFDLISELNGNAFLDIYLIQKDKYSASSKPIPSSCYKNKLYLAWAQWQKAVSRFHGKTKKRGGSFLKDSEIKNTISKLSEHFSKNARLVDKALRSKNDCVRILGIFSTPFILDGNKQKNKYFSILKKMIKTEKNLDVINAIGQSIIMTNEIRANYRQNISLSYISYMLTLPSTKVVNKGLFLLKQKVSKEKIVLSKKILKNLHSISKNTIPLNKKIIDRILKTQKG